MSPRDQFAEVAHRWITLATPRYERALAEFADDKDIPPAWSELACQVHNLVETINSAGDRISGIKPTALAVRLHTEIDAWAAIERERIAADLLATLRLANAVAA